MVENLTLIPIKSNEGAATYKITKYLTILLSSLTSSEYNIKNSYECAKSIKKTKIPPG